MTSPGWIDKGEEILTGVRDDQWGCDAFDLLDKYIASRTNHMSGINALGVTWDHGKYDLPAGEYKKQYELEKDIDLGMIRADANRILQAGKDQEALEELRTKAMENLKEHWNDSVTEAAHADFDANKKVVITNTDAAKENAKGILQVADSIQQLLKDKHDKTNQALQSLADSLKQNDADFEKKCESAAKNTQGGYDAESAEWMVTDQSNDKKSKVLTDLLNNRSEVRESVYTKIKGSDDAEKDHTRKIYWDGGPPTTYRFDVEWNPDRYLTGEELVRLKQVATRKLNEAGNSRKYYVEAGGVSEYQIWERKDVVTDMNNVMGQINDTCQQLLQLNYNTKNHISEQYHTMAGYLDNINTAPPQTPSTGNTGGGGTGGGGAGGGGSAASGSGSDSGMPPDGSPIGSELSSVGGGTGSGGGSALGSAGQALGSAGQALGQAVSGLGSALGGALSGLMGSLGQIIQTAAQAAQQAQQQQAEQEKDRHEKDKGRDDEDEDKNAEKNTDDNKGDNDGKDKQDEAKPDQPGASLSQAPNTPHHPAAPAAHTTTDPGPATATAPAGMGHAPATAHNDSGVHKQGDNNHGDFEVQATVHQVGAGNQGHITGFE
ncbi:hypothetical protein Srot_0223 [Segniliparus rotundus DSM 44985]|uniref:Uncharacterized protein n=1 Tax=Segniliparus rotundus (strain ATCC BAA-972 / CDC 1076 / CIP 108378 / DSM 44985 / JCM 13578) TaxID=640132 RepID=D6ZAG8_SEGRD|nr:hypothetical protein [Segniliparus rotundus]ADG96710.1 hypothetical protein Srot_0223 [Segniliparus rotundus DSM 44985]